jgi:hypothetical protein
MRIKTNADVEIPNGTLKIPAGQLHLGDHSSGFMETVGTGAYRAFTFGDNNGDLHWAMGCSDIGGVGDNPGNIFQIRVNPGSGAGYNFTNSWTSEGNVAISINDNRNFGIGTDSPDARLEVHAGSTSDIAKFANDSGSFILGKTANLGSLDMAADASFRIRHGSTLSAYFKSDGNVGIGTTSPSAKLHIHETVSSGTGILLTNNANTAGAYSDIKWQYSYSDSSYASGIRFKQVDTSHGGQIEFFTDNTVGTYTQQMTITEDGNVGIGTASPAGILHLDEGAADDCRLIAETHSGGDSMILFTQGASGAGTPTWGAGLDATGDVFSIGYEASGYNNFSLTTDSKLVIDTSGNVGIGTTPQSFSKLQVKAATNQNVSIFTNSSGLTIGGITDIGGSAALRIAGAPLHLTGRGGGAGSGPDIAIISNGKVGIGTTTPSHKLEVSGTLAERDGGDRFIESTNYNGDFYYYNSGVRVAGSGSGYKSIAINGGKYKYFEFEANVRGTGGANHQGLFWGNPTPTSAYSSGQTGFKTCHQNSSSFHIRTMGNSTQTTINPGFDPNDGVWHHQKVTATPDGYVRVYIDGELVIESSGYIPTAAGYVGFINYTGTADFNNFQFRGLSDEEVGVVSKLIAKANNYQLRLNRTDGAGDDWKFYSWESGLNIFPATASSVFFGRDGASTDVELYNGDLNVRTGVIKVGGTTVIDSSRNFIANSRLTFDYNDHYLESGTANLSLKNASNASLVTLGQESLFNGTIRINSHVGGIGDIDFGKAVSGHNTTTPARITAGSSGQLYLDSTQNQHIYLGWYNGSGYDVISEMNARFASYKDRSDTAYHVNPAGASQIRDLVIKGTTSDSAADALHIRNSGGTTQSYFRNDGTVVIGGSQYLYVTAGGGAYFDNSIKARGGILNDQGDLTLSDTVQVQGPLTIQGSGSEDRYLAFTLDGKNSAFSSSNNAYIFNGQGSTGDYLAGALYFQSRSNTASREIGFITGTTPAKRLVINNSGITVTGTITADGLTIANTDTGSLSNTVSDYSIVLEGAVGHGSYNHGIVFNESTDALAGIGVYDGGAGGQQDLWFATRNSSATYAERMRIDSSGNVGIGTSSPIYPLEVQSGGVGTVLRAGTSFVSIDSTGSAASPSLIFNGDADSGIYRAASDTLAIATGGSEAMRINSDGHLLVGTTTATPGNGNTDTGHLLKSDGRFFASSASNSQFNRNSQGDILTFRKSGGLVGSIGVASSDNLYIGASTANHSGVYFGTNIVYPMTAGSTSDNLVDLGNSSSRWKDLHLSGASYASSYRHDGDSDTYFNFPAANQLSLVGGGATIVKAYQIAGSYGVLEMHGSGSATYPNFTFNGDSNTGMYRATTDTLAFTTGGSEAMRIDSSGNVKIGDSSTDVTSKLVVSGNASADVATFMYDGNAGTYLDIDCGGANGKVELRADARSGSYPPLAFKTGGSEAMRIDSSGNVGIGTQIPIEKLDVMGKLNIQHGSVWSTGTQGQGRGSIHIDPASATDHAGGAITFGASDTSNGTTAQAGIYVRSDGSYGTKMYLSTTDNYTAGSKTAITIEHNGNVGIGTTSPNEKLEVNGNIKHNGLTMTSGTDIDQLYTATASLTLTTAWQDTGVNSSELATGSYMVQVASVNDYTVGGGHYSEVYTGVMSWYGGNPNSVVTDEIVLHRAGLAPNAGVIYLRTERSYAADTNDLMLQIAGATTNTGASTYTFKFRRMI